MSIISKEIKFQSLSNGNKFQVFREMINKKPLPSLSEFNRYLDDIYRSKDYLRVIHIFKDLLRIKGVIEPSKHTLSILTNSYARLHKTSEAFSILAYAIFRCFAEIYMKLCQYFNKHS